MVDEKRAQASKNQKVCRHKNSDYLSHAHYFQRTGIVTQAKTAIAVLLLF